MEKVVTILNEAGLHARPAGAFVKMASQFSSDINIEVNGKSLNAKSIMNLLSLGLKKGDEIKIVANGADEKEAVEALADLVNSKFGE
ncbi:HPr family phosphocarrier protein [Crassaminicella thermophila]|uniref:HPr family phosphocarrier protein n=1 Tax=Crassaminicella thermophila TaxID=2599308 RepID=A0A5C0SBM9_CRATE|nr:HPr family phosphocarrier protein [Crassaminicella thermophila]QEK11500.1 HPr family phosphocarrier protein [Crassaminicella thermophila]